jgi:hypothetical protein
MPRLTGLLLAIPMTAFLHGPSAYGHNCGHHGGCASSYSRDDGCLDCDARTSDSKDRTLNRQLTGHRHAPSR